LAAFVKYSSECSILWLVFDKANLISDADKVSVVETPCKF